MCLRGLLEKFSVRRIIANLCVDDQIKSPVISETCSRMTVPVGITRYNGQECNLDDLEPWLESFEGGKVEFSKDYSSGIACVVLNHASKRNAISGAMMVQLRQIVKQLENWAEGKGVLLSGSGTMFCSGGDLDFAKATAGVDGGFKMASYMQDVLSRFKALPMVSVALIHGKGAIGGGAEIITACDWRLMTRDCRGIGMVHIRMGIVPAWGGSSRLAGIIGSREALSLICSGKLINAEQALKIGLIDEIINPGISGSGINDGLSWLQERTKGDPQVIRTAKASMVNFNLLMNMDAALKEEKRLFAPLWGGPANQKALQSQIKHI